MADLRFDPYSNLWVAIARNRLQRPTEYVPIEQVQQQLLCPFCLGNEEETPAELGSWNDQGRIREGDESRWSTRVVPNKYPSLSDSDQGPEDCGPGRSLSRAGWQELIIPTPRHVDSWSALNPSELRVAVRAWQERWTQVNRRPEIAHAMLFLNCRSAAGASLSHIHWQLIGAPLVSPRLLERQARDEASLAETGQSWIERLTAWELSVGTRMITSDEQLAVFCPYASRFPLQTWVVPRGPATDFGEAPLDQLEAAARACQRIVAAMESILDRPAYNILLHHPPTATEDRPRQPWFFEIFPRLTCAAGFECGTDVWVNPVSPETAARRIRALETGSLP